jgi:hypothetical protein
LCPEQGFAGIDNIWGQLDTLVAGCTMTGPAHDQLHTWLIPLMGSVKNLAAADGVSDARMEVSEITKTLHAFDDFFEGK